MLAKLLAKFWRARSSLATSESGNVLMITGLALPVLLGVAGLGIEGAGWYNTRRAMQNAADAAVVAAATNGDTVYYLTEARAVTAQYGFTDGSGNTTVTASNAATCPAGGTNCYSVTVTKDVPLVFSRVVGFTGSATVGSQSAIRLTTTSIANFGTTQRNYCILTLGDGSGTSSLAFDVNGGPKADLTGCNIGSMESMDCSGHDLEADWADAMGSVSGCGVNRLSGVAAMTDPYEARNSDIPSDTCGGSYPGASWSAGSKTLSSTPTTICGDLTVSGTVTLNGTGLIVIYNGSLMLADDAVLQTGTGGGTTIIFSGTNGSSSHIFDGGKDSAFDLKAPTTGTWAGIVLYQDPDLTTNVDLEVKGGGNSPTYKLTGVVYLPNAHLLFSGSVNKATDGAACLVLVTGTMRINGGGDIVDRGNCAAAGVSMPSGTITGRATLVD